MPDASNGRARQNAMLLPLSQADYRRVVDEGDYYEAAIREPVYEPGGPIDNVFFPVTSVFSLVALVDGRSSIEVGTIGREGMVGLPVFLGGASSPNAAYCQVPGEVLRLPAERFRAVMSRNSATMHRQLHRFTQATMVQLAQNVACNRSHATRQRAARWLLMTHDRVASDEFPLTQEFLAQMLAVRRATANEAATQLQADGVIRYRRGLMTILDRRELEAVSCSCYGVLRDEFAALSRTD